MNKYLQIAIDEAKKTVADIPVGAVIVKDGKVIATAHNSREKDNDVTSHAEILAIKKAEQKFGNWRLNGCDLYVTLEPCPMCGWAILQSRINRVYFGSYDTKYGAFTSSIDLRNLCGTNLEVYGGIMEKECDAILSSFFENIRQ